MSRVTSNRAEIERALDDLANAFDFTQSGAAGRGLAEEALDVLTNSIFDRTVGEQVQADGTPLAELSPKYLARKVGQGHPALIGVRTGLLMSQVEMHGERTIDSEGASAVYGVTDQAKAEAEWFTEGDASRNREPRPFYEIGPDTEAALDEFFERALDRFLNESGGH